LPIKMPLWWLLVLLILLFVLAVIAIRSSNTSRKLKRTIIQRNNYIRKEPTYRERTGRSWIWRK